MDDHRRELKKRGERARWALAFVNRERICEICTRLDYEFKGHLGVYHVREPQHGGTEDPENLRYLCPECYTLVQRRRREVAKGPDALAPGGARSGG